MRNRVTEARRKFCDLFEVGPEMALSRGLRPLAKLCHRFAVSAFADTVEDHSV